jgi:hypothetical protein
MGAGAYGTLSPESGARVPQAPNGSAPWMGCVRPRPRRGGHANSGTIRPGSRLTIETTVDL